MKIVEKETFHKVTRKFVDEVLVSAGREFLCRGGSPGFLSQANIDKVTNQIVDAFYFLWDDPNEIHKS